MRRRLGGPRSTVEAPRTQCSESGVQSSPRSEPFDGNIAVAISATPIAPSMGAPRSLRIGERHLLDLLDFQQDPLHVDPAMNRIRTALAFGYPDSLRLVFDHGFAERPPRARSGSRASISIGELRGIPMGPIVDKMLAPLLDWDLHQGNAMNRVLALAAGRFAPRSRRPLGVLQAA